MQKKPTNPFVAARLRFLAVMTGVALAATQSVPAASFEKLHDLRAFPSFASKAAITNFFFTQEVPIKLLPLNNFETNNCIVASYPYSGNSTIDIYHFVKFGDRWELKMFLYHLRPRDRQVRVKETATEMILFDNNVQFLAITVDQTLNSLDR